jgi:hypothetical protein
MMQKLTSCPCNSGLCRRGLGRPFHGIGRNGMPDVDLMCPIFTTPRNGRSRDRRTGGGTRSGNREVLMQACGTCRTTPIPAKQENSGISVYMCVLAHVAALPIGILISGAASRQEVRYELHFLSVEDTRAPCGPRARCLRRTRRIH